MALFTTETASEMGKKGGVRSGESRRGKKTMRETLSLMLESEYEGGTYLEAIFKKLLEKAVGGDIGAIRTIWNFMHDRRGLLTPSDTAVGNYMENILASWRDSTNCAGPRPEEMRAEKKEEEEFSEPEPAIVTENTPAGSGKAGRMTKKAETWQETGLEQAVDEPPAETGRPRMANICWLNEDTGERTVIFECDAQEESGAESVPEGAEATTKPDEDMRLEQATGGDNADAGPARCDAIASAPASEPLQGGGKSAGKRKKKRRRH